MPHAIIQYSGNLTYTMIESDTDLVDMVHGLMMESKLFDLPSIKTHAYCSDNWMVGEKGQDGTFIHVTVSLLPGRTLAQRQTLSETLVNALGKQVPESDQVTVEIVELNKETYRKFKA